MKTPYDVLGVTQNASPDEIKRLYREAALNAHPDRNKDPNATRKMQEINAAYEALKDPVKYQQWVREQNQAEVDNRVMEEQRKAQEAEARARRQEELRKMEKQAADEAAFKAQQDGIHQREDARTRTESSSFNPTPTYSAKEGAQYIARGVRNDEIHQRLSRQSFVKAMRDPLGNGRALNKRLVNYNIDLFKNKNLVWDDHQELVDRLMTILTLESLSQDYPGFASGIKQKISKLVQEKPELFEGYQEMIEKFDLYPKEIDAEKVGEVAEFTKPEPDASNIISPDFRGSQTSENKLQEAA